MIISRFAHTLVELVNTSACINELLLACVERVALGADVNTEVILRGPCLKCLTASTTDCYQLGLGMDVCFHFFHLSIKDMTRKLLYVCHTGFPVSGDILL